MEARLRRALALAGAEIAEFPAVSHENVVQRALDRRQPFDQRGRDGYRDTVLWHTVLEIAANSEVDLVSNDARAFADGSDGGKLASRLEKEVPATCGEEGRVRLVRELRELTAELAEIDESTLAAVSELVRQRSFRTLLEEQLEDAVAAAPLDMEAVIELDLGAPAADAFIVGLDELGAVTARRAYTLPNGDALVDLDVVAGLPISVQFHDRAYAQALRSDSEFWLVRDQEWDELRPGQAVTLGTIRLGHVYAEASIALPAGRLERLDATGVRLVSGDEQLEEPQVVDDAE